MPAQTRLIEPRIVRAAREPDDLPAVALGDDWIRMTDQDCAFLGMASHTMNAAVLTIGSSRKGDEMRRMASVVAVVGTLRMARRIHAAMGPDAAVVAVRINDRDHVYLEPDVGWDAGWIPPDAAPAGGE